MGWLDGLSTSQLKAINTIDEDLEIIACAGAGKTGVVTRRIVNIIKTNNVSPENIVAFTFTDKAAEELKDRIYKYAKEVLGNTKGFAGMYVGTIHGFCLKMLQEYIPEFQKFTVLDEIKSKLFINKHFKECGMENIGYNPYKNGLDFGNCRAAMSLLIENGVKVNTWKKQTKEAVKKYKDYFYSKKYFDYSLIMAEMVAQLETNRAFSKTVYERVKYLTVDEYQDINPIQEKLISLLKKNAHCNLCIVGDDDQTIYEFRGSDPNNILTFQSRYGIAEPVMLDVDYRSSNAVVDIASRIISHNKNRLSKTINSGKLVKYEKGNTVYKEFKTAAQECTFIAERIKEMHEAGVPYSEMAVLIRTKKFGKYVTAALDKLKIPCIVEGVNELFNQPECIAAQNIFGFLAGDVQRAVLHKSWMDLKIGIIADELDEAIDELSAISVDDLEYGNEFVLQKVFHDFLKTISIVESKANRSEYILYNLGKYSQVINDFETINFNSTPKNKLKYFNNFIRYEAAHIYPEGYRSNSYIRPDAVSIMTVHQSKGLEYTAVFVPQLNRNYFPIQKMGGKSIWSFIDKSYVMNSARIAGDNETLRIESERKLFYVAVTRAKKYLVITRSPSPTNEKANVASEFLTEARKSRYLIEWDPSISYLGNKMPKDKKEKAPITFNFSILSDYFDCAYRFKLSMFYGFVQPIVAEMGYGTSMHAIVQTIHRKVIAGEALTVADVARIVDENFYLPFANPKLEEKRKKKAHESAKKYFETNEAELKDVTMAEADIELDLGDGIKVNGRIDLVKKHEESGEEKTYIVDFKTASRDVTECINAEQLKIYALGYEILTGERADYLEIYNLDNSKHEEEAVTDDLLTNVKKDINEAADKIRSNDLPRICSKEKCSDCYLNYLCLTRAEKSKYGVK